MGTVVPNHPHGTSGNKGEGVEEGASPSLWPLSPQAEEASRRQTRGPAG